MNFVAKCPDKIQISVTVNMTIRKQAYPLAHALSIDVNTATVSEVADYVPWKTYNQQGQKCLLLTFYRKCLPAPAESNNRMLRVLGNIKQARKSSYTHGLIHSFHKQCERPRKSRA